MNDPIPMDPRARFEDEFRRFHEMSAARPARFSVDPNDIHPCLNDRTEVTEFDPHYIYHTGWAARKLAQFTREYHVDISSSLYFSSIVSAFVPVRVYDYRAPPLYLDNLRSAHADLANLPFPDNSLRSLSCMHVVEHVGLGRYGDALDPEGDLKAMAELKRTLISGGQFLFVVPVGGRARVVFNAHRIYRFEQIVTCFQDLTLEEFALVPDNPGREGLIRYASGDLADRQVYGCGCFCFRKEPE